MALQLLVAGQQVNGSNISCAEGQGGVVTKVQEETFSPPLQGPGGTAVNQAGSDLACWGSLLSHVRAESLELPKKSS